MKTATENKSLIPMDQNANETTNELLQDPTWAAIPDEHAMREPVDMPMLKTLWYIMPMVLFGVFFFWMLYCLTSENPYTLCFGTIANCIGWLVSLEWCEIKYKG